MRLTALIIFTEFIICLAQSNNAVAQTKIPTTPTSCDEQIVVALDVPDGSISLEVKEGKPVIVTVRQFIGRGYYGLATANIALRPGTKVTSSDRGTALTLGTTTKELPSGLAGLQALVPFLDLSKLTLVQEDNLVGFRLNIDWTHEIKAPEKAESEVEQDNIWSQRRSMLLGQLSARDVLDAGYQRAIEHGSTTRQPGYQWFVSPMLSVKIDVPSTLARIRPCVTTLNVTRTANPKPTGKSDGKLGQK